MYQAEIKVKIEPPFEPQELANLARLSHDNAVEKGWWGEDAKPGQQGSELYAIRDHDEVMLLCISELIEAFEEYRKKDSDVTHIYYADTEEAAKKPEGFPIELADCAIRVLDNLQCQQVDINRASQLNSVPEILWYVTHYKNFRKTSSMGTQIMAIVECFGVWSCQGAGATRYGIRALYLMFALADMRGIDLKDAIILKHGYNKTRPYRHGGKRC